MHLPADNGGNKKPMTTLLLVGTTGLVGSEIRKQAADDDRVGSIVALARRPLPSAPKLESHQVDFDDLPEDALWWAADAVICTLGTTMAGAGSRSAFHKVDHDYPLTIARLARAAGTPAFVLNSAIGASTRSPFFYSRTKGRLEQDLRACHYPSLTLIRPGLIGGEREEKRPVEQMAKAASEQFSGLLPQKLQINPATRIASMALEAAVQASPGVRLIESSEMTG